MRTLVTSKVFQDLCHDLIGPNARLYWDMAVYKKPDTIAQFPWHQDNGYTFVDPQQYLTCWVALSDATLENGCPWVLPGAHKQGTLAHRATRVGLARAGRQCRHAYRRRGCGHLEQRCGLAAGAPGAWVGGLARPRRSALDGVDPPQDPTDP